MCVHTLCDAEVPYTNTHSLCINSGSALSHACFCYALACSFPVSAYIILVTSLRHHLFIWSVFSPKLLYEGMHVLITAAICVFFTAMDQTNTKS